MEELLMNRFVEIFGEKGTACYFAPGRINLMNNSEKRRKTVVSVKISGSGIKCKLIKQLLRR